jgi:NAD+ synthase (glutamine-hydrolysing)
MAVNAAQAGDKQVIEDMFKLTGTRTSLSANELCNHILHTAYMGTENSSGTTKNRAESLAKAVGSFHVTFCIDLIVKAILTVFSSISAPSQTIVNAPRYSVKGGSDAEDLALQNIQARIRMVMAYLCAQLFPWLRRKPSFLLVLSSANVDEALRGYMTKYDCSSGDINPIGGICKSDLKQMLIWASSKFEIPAIKEIADAKPTAELRPLDESSADYTQLDEDEMGMTYDELSIYGKLRKVSRCGPVTMFVKLLEVWSHLTPLVIADKVKRFFKYYAINRHKMTTLTPSYHAENYSPDDNRFDLRQFLYNCLWPRQFRTIDDIAAQRMEHSKSI